MKWTQAIQAHTVGQRLAAARELSGLTRGQMARLLGVRIGQIHDWEAAARRVPAWVADRYGNACVVETAWITDGKMRPADAVLQWVFGGEDTIPEVAREEVRAMLRIYRGGR